MSDHGKTIDTLPTKDETTLSLTDTLLGVDAIQEPAAFQATLGAIAARLVEPLGEDLPESSDFLDALADGLISRLIGPVEENEHGSFVRHENGLQLCWKSHSISSPIAVNVANSGWGYRSGQQDTPFPAGFIENVRTIVIPNVNTVGWLATSAATSASNFTFHLVSGASVNVTAGAVMLFAIGRWK